jgi:hypothetical protein
VNGSRAEQADAWRDYFDLQLRFAEAVAAVRTMPLAEAVGLYTNFHRRFGLGRVAGAPSGPEWRAYGGRLEACATHASRLAWTREYFLQCADEHEPDTGRRFGCFSYDPPDGQGVVRIHFVNRDRDATGPLSRARIERRRGELVRMVHDMALRCPDARVIRGTSWLYHLEAYRRLFPPEYSASRKLVAGAGRYQGNSNWGQFLDHEGRVKADRRAQFLAALPALDTERLWAVFPLPAQRTEAPLECFLAFYRGDGGAS